MFMDTIAWIWTSDYFNKAVFLLRMSQKRNVKSESEEITIILFENGKVLCQVENERNIELFSVMRFWEKQVFFGRNIEESLVMRFPKSQIFSQEISRKDFDPLLGQVDYDLWQPLAGKADLRDHAPQAGYPRRKSLCFARDIGQSLPQKAACWGGGSTNLTWIICKVGVGAATENLCEKKSLLSFRFGQQAFLWG